MRKFDVVVVGAGFAGLYMVYRLRGLGFTVRAVEVGDDVGGTWYWNRYPGARCDVESLEYSYQFSEELQQEWSWSERYSGQPEILRYANHVADRFDLRRDIEFGRRVVSTRFDEAASGWRIEVASADASTSAPLERDGNGNRAPNEIVFARFVVMATGCLSAANLPEFPGIDDFEGAKYHTGAWPHEDVDFTGLRVGIVGTGSSAIQAIPVIAQEAAHLTVFQRTPNYSIPAQNGPMDRDREADVKAEYPAFRARNKRMPAGLGADMNAMNDAFAEVRPEERRRRFEERWEYGGFSFMASFADMLASQEANDAAAGFVREKIRGIVDDREVADLLSPHNVIGCKRICLDSGYFETFNRSNVTLVDVSSAPIGKITESGLRTGGRDYELDAIVFATGFDAMTGALTRIDIRGRGGRSLRSKWEDGPRAYLGLGVAGFPNLFVITGPGSPSVLSNMLPSIEQHVDWIADCMAWMRNRGHAAIEATPEAENEWVAHVGEVAGATLYPTCNSWYLGANVPGKPRVFMPYLGFPPYVEKCDAVAANDYEGFELT
ncbi:MAG: NAD(P)/FAD-dependent oxidoreductase [Holophagales bacterium]|nr:NAD(P)/FAD-dependent oxidoreductase [Holophagales bacterium]MYD21925.1 NAD(P)/FAD-dependent oxidoreductase [Holophagales bacterium]MYI31878.1 NAD(P)/FAD-dependent oxidoreductase [Holophagales bacterium]